jgi:hypothetical protein
MGQQWEQKNPARARDYHIQKTRERRGKLWLKLVECPRCKRKIAVHPAGGISSHKNKDGAWCK